MLSLRLSGGLTGEHCFPLKASKVLCIVTNGQWQNSLHNLTTWETFCSRPRQHQRKNLIVNGQLDLLVSEINDIILWTSSCNTPSFSETAFIYHQCLILSWFMSLSWQEPAHGAAVDVGSKGCVFFWNISNFTFLRSTSCFSWFDPPYMIPKCAFSPKGDRDVCSDVSRADMLVSQRTSWPNGFIILGCVISVMCPDRLTAKFLWRLFICSVLQLF